MLTLFWCRIAQAREPFERSRHFTAIRQTDVERIVGKAHINCKHCSKAADNHDDVSPLVLVWNAEIFSYRESTVSVPNNFSRMAR
jgi:hypothetical protein